MMILKRQAAHARRIEQYRKWTAWGSDMQREASLWRGLGAADEEWGQGWEEEPRKMLKGMEESFERGRRREGMKFSREMVGRVEEARKRRERRKQAWGMRRREEAARGVDGAAGGEPEVSERREKAVETGTSTSST